MPADTNLAEVLEPLSVLEAALVAMAGKWRDEKQTELERAYAQLLADANARIKPVLTAHGVVDGVEWDIRQDASAASGWVLAKKVTKDQSAIAATSDASTPPLHLSRSDRRRATKEITKTVKRGARS